MNDEDINIDLRLYLGGPIQGCSDEECNAWRDKVLKYFPRSYNPMLKDCRGIEMDKALFIVETDKREILHSDALLVNLGKMDKMAIGTCMEIMFAYMHEIPIYIVQAPSFCGSPWLVCHARKIFTDLDKAMEYLL
jgi:nucleoside 2-deoxyribosyltransferase